MADEELSKLPEVDVAMVKSHYVCIILLNRAAHYFTKLKRHGLMTEREAGEFHEQIEEYAFQVYECRAPVHEDEMTDAHKVNRMSKLPVEMLRAWNILEEMSSHDESKETSYPIQPIDEERPTALSLDELIAKKEAEAHQPDGEEKTHSVHLSQHEKDELGLDGSDVVISACDAEALRNLDINATVNAQS